MSNILITEVCNLRCPYCFASDILEKDHHLYHVQTRDFVKFFKWLDQKEIIKLLGGEPTVHPEYETFVKLAFSKGFQTVNVFTNGLLLDKYYHLAKYKGLVYTVNVNTVKNLGKEKANKLKQNILNYPDKKQLCLGVTIYDKDMDLSFIKTLFVQTNIHKGRVGIASPAYNVKNKFEYFSELKSKALEFYRFCVEHNIDVGIECNNIPYCIWSEAEISYLNINKRSGCYINECNPVVDYHIDGNLSHCLTTSEFDTIPSKYFKNHTEAENFYKELYAEIRNELLEPECKKCPHYGVICQGGCMGVRKDEFKAKYQELAPKHLEKWIKDHNLEK